jgi:hypothetical protein
MKKRRLRKVPSAKYKSYVKPVEVTLLITLAFALLLFVGIHNDGSGSLSTTPESQSWFSSYLNNGFGELDNLLTAADVIVGGESMTLDSLTLNLSNSTSYQ